jgi:DNA-binding MarR family transcriptional regulator
MEARQRSEFERRKRGSVAQLLIRAARLLNERGVARVRAGGASELRPVHMTLLPHLDLEGTRLTELARRMGISKQAVGQIVGNLETMGLVERVPDPSDGRARLVRFSKRGERALSHGLGVLETLEAELSQKVGATRMRELRRALLALLEELEKPG